MTHTTHATTNILLAHLFIAFSNLSLKSNLKSNFFTNVVSDKPSMSGRSVTDVNFGPFYNPPHDQTCPLQSRHPRFSILIYTEATCRAPRLSINRCHHSMPPTALEQVRRNRKRSSEKVQLERHCPPDSPGHSTGLGLDSAARSL